MAEGRHAGEGNDGCLAFALIVLGLAALVVYVVVLR